jgi:benzil reductase ((S)-benzoin forming)
MKYKTVIITGVSSGLGYACARFFLSQGFQVIGIGRNHSLEHDAYDFHALDLSDTKAVEAFSLPKLANANDVILMNNAGIIGEIKPFWEQHLRNLSAVVQVNVAALTMLTHKFINQYDSGLIINISSGAAQRPIKAWSAYCASKAAVDLFSETLQEEFTHFNKPFIVKSIAPGVVNTDMQREIRQADKSLFPDSANFHDLFTSGNLDDTELTAKKLYHVITSLESYTPTVLSLRSVDIAAEDK